MNAPVQDDNDRAITGQLPEDPRADAKRIVDAPRILTPRELLVGCVRRADQPHPRGLCSTGNRFLDEKTGGIRPGLSWLVGAPTNWGKTNFVIALADDNLKAGRGVLIVSLEDPEELYADRLMLRRCCVRSRDTKGRSPMVLADNLRLKRLRPEEKVAMREVAAKGERKPSFIDASGWSGEKITKELDRILKNVPIDLVLVDYLQEVQSEREHKTERAEVKHMAAALRNVCKRNSVSLVITSQITEKDDPDRWPRMNQIRDSRDVVNAAAYVVMGGVAQSDIPVSKKDPTVALRTGDRGVRIEKVKSGRKGLVKLPWDDDAACFLPVRENADDQPDDEPPAWARPREGDIDDFEDMDQLGRDMRAGKDQW